MACSILMFEILLTRICALRLIFHFGFLVVSNCMLGIGASGTLIMIARDRFSRNPRFWIGIFCLLYLASLVVTYAFLTRFHVNSDFTRLWTPDTVRFFIYTFSGTLPLFFGGCVIGLILTFHTDIVNQAYGFDLVGAGIGCLLSPLFLTLFGAGGCMVFLTMIAVIPVFSSYRGKLVKLVHGAGVLLIVAGIFMLPHLDRWFPINGKNDLQLTEKDHAKLIRNNIEFSEWSAISRIDMQPVRKEDRLLFCRGSKTEKLPLPEEKLIVQDCVAGTWMLNFGENPGMLESIRQSLYSASIRLRKNPSVFIIGVGGGNDVWAAKIANASRVRGIELNKQILRIHREILPSWSRPLLEDENIELIYGEGRSAIMREPNTYDIVQMTGIDTWTGLTSGAYVLAENYLYTVEALRTMYDRLNENGFLQVTRMAADMETLRMCANIDAMLAADTGSRLDRSIALMKTREPLMTTIIRKGEFTEQEVSQLEAFCDEGGIEPVYLPGRKLGTVVEEFVRADNKQVFIDQFPRNIRPTTDNMPYFFNFTRWDNLFESRKYLRDITSVSQGNPFFLFLQLGISSLMALILILLPIIFFRRNGVERHHLGRFVVFFAGLGLGFIWIEMAMIQKLTLFLGHPLYSITVTLFAMLVFTGAGSLISRDWFGGPGPKIWLVPAGIAVLVMAIIVGANSLLDSLISLSLVWRIMVTILLLCPVSLLLGVPFAYGIRLLNRVNPTLIPLAWAVNGCLTVIGSILTVILSMNFGFNVVMLLAAIVYLGAFFAIRGTEATI
jgi:hypothetical protein